MVQEVIDCLAGQPTIFGRVSTAPLGIDVGPFGRVSLHVSVPEHGSVERALGSG